MAKSEKPGARDSADEPEVFEVAVSPAEVLAALARLDLEAALAYEGAARLSGDAEVSRQLAAFAHDHRRHAETLNRVLEREGEAAVAPPAGEPSLLAGLMTLAGPLGPDVIVVALLGNEQLTNLGYDGALAYEWDDEDEAMLEAFAADEQRHLAWLAERHDRLARHAPGAERPGATE